MPCRPDTTSQNCQNDTPPQAQLTLQHPDGRLSQRAIEALARLLLETSLEPAAGRQTKAAA